MMRGTGPRIAALVPAAVAFAVVALAGVGAPEVDFEKGRAADPDFDLHLELPAKSARKLTVAAGSKQGYAFVLLGPGRQGLLGWCAGGRTRTVKAVLPGAAGERKVKCVIKVRTTVAPHISLVLNGRRWGRIGLPALEAPLRIALVGGAGVRVVRYQKIARGDPVLFTDDFTRQGAVLGTWQPDRKGLWSINADPHPETSASPFALECKRAAKPTLVRAGEEFWDDYRARVAACVLESPGAAGLAFNLGQRGGYLLRLVVEGRGTGGSGRAELLRIDARGAVTVIAGKPLAGTPGCWYVLELGSVGGSLRAWVDGSELAALKDRADLTGGRVGLWSSGRSPVRFDDLRVEALELTAADFRSGRGLAPALRHWFLPAPRLPAYFRRDRSMRSWARIEEEYVAAGAGYWHRARLAGPQEIRWERPGSPLSRGQLVLALCADGKDFSSGYRMVADLGAGGANAAIIALFARNQRVAGKVVALPGAGIERLSFSREAGALVARAGSRVVLAAPDKLKLEAGRAGARALGGWALQRSELATAAGNLLDEVFARAPVDWQAVTGRWEVASRWKCDPEYTWMLGRQRRGVARIDLKRPVRGDFQLDLHFAMAMSERCAPFYDFPTNLSVSLSPDPRRPTAGYVFAFGGIDRPGRILRAGKPVAAGSEMVRPDARAPGNGGGVHSHWFHLRAVRRGSRLVLYGDGQKLCEFNDARPLAGADNLSVWTRNGNGVVMARFRLEAAGALGPRRSPFAAAERKIEALPEGPAHFANRDGRSGARVFTRRADAGGNVLRLENLNSGGTFAAACAPPGGIDLAAGGRLTFSWKTSPGARVNVYLVKNGRFYRAELTGGAARTGGRYNLVHLGTVPNARAGGSEWQRFSCDLGAALASIAPGREIADLRVEEIRIGNYEFEDSALLEGYTGNGPGEWVDIRDWRLGGPGGGPGGTPLCTLAVDAPGARIRDAGRVQVPAFADPRDLSLVAGGRVKGYDNAALRFDAFRRVLRLDPRAAGLSLREGRNDLSIRVSAAGGGRPRSAAVIIDFDPGLDKRPPTLPRLVSPAPLERCDFERSLGTWRGFGGLDGAQLSLDPRETRYGRHCLFAENRRCGGTLAATARTRPFDLRRYPTLCFDYRVEPATHVNLLLFTTGARHEVRLTDSRGGAYNLGQVPGAAPDGRWRRAALDLRKLLRWRHRTIVRAIGFADYGPGSSTTASAYRIDNWVLLPAINGKRAVRFRWRADDESGIAGYSAVLDRLPQTVPGTTPTTASPEMLVKNGMEAGTWYLHVRARDRAGNWGPAAHWRFSVSHHEDKTPPAVKKTSPAAGATGCPRYVEVDLHEAGSGISAHDVELRVGKRVFRPGDQGVTFYPAENRMRAELTGFDGRLLVSPGRLKCSVRATDYAGNVMPAHSWTWNLDLSADRSSPPAPKVIYVPSDHLVFQDFESGQGTFCNWRRGITFRRKVRSRGQAGTGRWYAATNGRRLHDNNNETQIWARPFDPERYSYLAFDYRLGQQVSFDFLLEINNLHHTLHFGPHAARWGRRLGRLTRTVADGNWHRAEVDLRALRDRFPKRSGDRMAIIQKLLTVSRTQDGADLDNFVLASPYGKHPAFIWEAPQATSGIGGYSWMLDSEATTEPPEKVKGNTTRARYRNVQPGTYWFHVRACSGAGLWGSTRHLRIRIEDTP